MKISTNIQNRKFRKTSEFRTLGKISVIINKAIYQIDILQCNKHQSKITENEEAITQILNINRKLL